MENFFAKPFAPETPCSPEQYINEMFRLAMSLVREGITVEETQLLRSITLNTKASFEHHKSMVRQPLLTEIDELKKQMKEKDEENASLRALTEKGTLESLDELREQLKAKNEEIATWKTQFENKLQENLKDLAAQLDASRQEIAGLRAHFETALETEIQNRKLQLEDAMRSLSLKDEKLLRLTLEKKVEIVNVQAEHAQIIASTNKKHQEEIAELNDDKVELTVRIKSLEIESKKNSEVIEQLKKDIRRANANNLELVAKMKELKTNHENNNESENAKINELRDEIEELAAQNAKLTAQIRDLEYYERSDFYSAENIEAIDKRISGWQEERQKLLDKCAERMRDAGVFDVEALQNEVEKLQFQGTKWRSQLQELIMENQSFKDNYRTMDREIRNLQRDKENLKNELQASRYNNNKSDNKMKFLNEQIELKNQQLNRNNCKQQARNY